MLTHNSDTPTILTAYRRAIQKAQASGHPLRKTISSFHRYCKENYVITPDILTPQKGIIEVRNPDMKTYGAVTTRYHALLHLQAALEDDTVCTLVCMHGAYAVGKSSFARTLAKKGTVIFDAPNLARADRDQILKLGRGYRVRCELVTVRCPLQTAIERNDAREPLDRVPHDALLRSFKRVNVALGKEGWDDVVPVDA